MPPPLPQGAGELTSLMIVRQPVYTERSGSRTLTDASNEIARLRGRLHIMSGAVLLAEQNRQSKIDAEFVFRTNSIEITADMTCSVDGDVFEIVTPKMKYSGGIRERMWQWLGLRQVQGRAS